MLLNGKYEMGEMRPVKETIDNLNLLTVLSGLKNNKTSFSFDKLSLQVAQYPNSIVYRSELNDKVEKHLSVIQETNTRNISSSKGLKIGDATSKIFEAYGSPSGILDAGTTTYAVYTNFRIVFVIKRGLLERWLVFV